MKKNPTYNDLNTIFILNYKRKRIFTIETLEKIGYDGNIVIILQDTDPYIDYIKETYGKYEIEVINRDEAIIPELSMDNFNDTKCVYPNRNISRELAEKRGLIRYWLFDDDYTRFAYKNSKNKTKVINKAETLKALFSAISEFGYKTGAANVGFVQAVANYGKYDTRKKVYNFHNLPTDKKLFLEFRGRTNEDMVQGIDGAMRAKLIVGFTNVRGLAKPPEEQTGGLTEIYSQDGQYNKSYYAILANPGISKISKQFTTLTRYYHKVNLSKIAPKIVPIKYKKEVGSDVV